jgi:hypothetical protein
MKMTEYFAFRRRLPDRVEITDAWVEQVLRRPDGTQTQSDGRIRMWARIDEAGG